MTARRRGSSAGSLRFPCVRCGTLLRREPGHPPRIRCPVCRYRMYDYPRPCAGIIVLKGDRVLVLRRGHPPKRGWLDTPGGFIDAGESIDGAARRELREETGLVVGRLEWIGYYWDRYYLKGFGYIPTLNFYFLARWRSGEPRAADDAASVEWASIEDLGRRGARMAFRHMTRVIRDVQAQLNGGVRPERRAAKPPARRGR